MAKKPRFKVYESGFLDGQIHNTGDEVMIIFYLRNMDEFDLVSINSRGLPGDKPRYFEFTICHPDSDYFILGREWKRDEFVKVRGVNSWF